MTTTAQESILRRAHNVHHTHFVVVVVVYGRAIEGDAAHRRANTDSISPRPFRHSIHRAVSLNGNDNDTTTRRCVVWYLILFFSHFILFQLQRVYYYYMTPPFVSTPTHRMRLISQIKWCFILFIKWTEMSCHISLSLAVCCCMPNHFHCIKL